MKKTCLFILMLIAVCAAGVLNAPARTALSVGGNEILSDAADGIISWRKSKLKNGELADWFTLGAGAYGYEDNYAAYLDGTAAYITKKYKEKNKLGTAATEWHRIALAVTAAGGDPTAIGEYNGEPVNLIADGVYNRENIGKQGLNGFIWGLIALDSKRYDVPGGAINTRDSMIEAIINAEISGGGFALTGTNPDPDITGMAVQALSPYYGDSAAARDVIDRAIEWLSAAQGADGDFASFGAFNSGSAVWAMLACLSVGTDPLTDARFIKNGNTVLDGIMKYRRSDGGFAHSEAALNVSNAMASDAALYGLAGLIKFKSGKGNLFDFRNHGVTDAGNNAKPRGGCRL